MESMRSSHSAGPTAGLVPHDIDSSYESFRCNSISTKKTNMNTGSPLSDFNQGRLPSDISPLVHGSDTTPSPPMDNWTLDKEDTNLSEKLLDMEFHNDIHTNDVNSLLYVPSFQDTSSYNPLFPLNDVTPFIQDKKQLQECEQENSLVRSIDPQFISIQNEDPIFETAQPSPPEVTIKTEPNLHAGELDMKNTTFTAFSPMRLDDDTSFSIKPLSSLQSRNRSPTDSSDLRPPLDEYNKLSSKEKRQLRNKISARNFRNRRKEYIGLLEEQLTERDSLIQSLQEQISNLRLENTHLQEELRAQKPKSTSAMDVSKILSVLQRNAQNPETLDPANSRPNTRGSPRLQALTATNTRKDLAAASRPGSPSSSFWGGVGNMSTLATAVA